MRQTLVIISKVHTRFRPRATRKCFMIFTSDLSSPLHALLKMFHIKQKTDSNISLVPFLHFLNTLQFCKLRWYLVYMFLHFENHKFRTIVYRTSWIYMYIIKRFKCVYLNCFKMKLLSVWSQLSFFSGNIFHDLWGNISFRVKYITFLLG